MIVFLEKIRKQREFKLIINADDFGISKSITDGIIEGISDGYITSTSIMANMEYAEYAIREAI